MAGLYANENFPLPVVLRLRESGHIVVTVQETGNISQPISDPHAFEFAASHGWVILTLNRKHFFLLHEQNSDHAGIIAWTVNATFARQAERIYAAISAEASLAARLIGVNRPGPGE